SREIWWLHGARNGAEEPFAAESRSRLEALSHAHRHICYSRPAADDVQGRDYETAGRLTSAVLSGLGRPRDADAYLCGPAPFRAAGPAALVTRSPAPAGAHLEIFGPARPITPGIAPAGARPPHLPAGAAGDGPPVAFARSGLTVPWDPRYASLL